MQQPTYYAVFYDVKHPRDSHYAMNKRIDYNMYRNLNDGFEGKQVALRRNDKEPEETYRVKSTATFVIHNSFEYSCFIICEIEKIK